MRRSSGEYLPLGKFSLVPFREAPYISRSGNIMPAPETCASVAAQRIAEKVATWRRKGPRKWDHKYPPKLIGEHRAIYSQ